MISSEVIQAISAAKNYPYINKVGVFGSCARNEETAESDIDILIDYDSSSDDFLDNLDGFMEDMENLMKNVFLQQNSSRPAKIDYVTMAGLAKSTNESVKRSILQDVKWVYVNKKICSK